MIVIATPLSEYNFNTPFNFNSGGVLFNFITGTPIGTSDIVTYQINSMPSLLTQINVITAYLQVCRAKLLLSLATTEDVLIYTKRRGVVTRWKKIYDGFEKNQDSPTPLFGVS